MSLTSVRSTVGAGSLGLDQARLDEWERWASAEADRLDPVLSRQILTHLAPLEEDG